MSEIKSSSKNAGYEYIDHPADVWVHSWGPTFESAIEQCVYSLMDTMLDTKTIENKIEYKISLQEESPGSLLVGFLSEFLYLFDVKGLVFQSIDINPIQKLKSGKLKIDAIGHGEIFNLEKHIPDTEVKAITYSYLEIDDRPEKTEIKIVYDI